MSGTDDLVAAAMPYLATQSLHGTAGMDWIWFYDDIRDDDDALVDWTGCTGTAKLYDSFAVLRLTCTVTFPADGQVKVTAADTDTGPLLSAGKDPENTNLEVEIVTATGLKFLIVGARKATLTIHSQAG